MIRRDKQAHLAMVVSTLLIATSFPVVAAVAGTLDSAVLTLLRFSLASLLFLPLVVLRHGREALPDGRSLLRYALLSAPLVGFFFAMFESMRTTTAVNTGAIYTLGPGFTALFSFLVLKVKLARRELLAILIATVGATWVVVGGSLSRLLSLDLVRGDAFFLAGTVSMSLYSTLIKRLHRGEPMEVMTLWTLVTGAGWLLLVGGGELGAVRWAEIDPRVLGWVAYLTVFTTIITFFLVQRAAIAIGPTRMMAYTYLNPTLVALLSWGLGEGGLRWETAPGIALTLVAMIALQRGGPGGDASQDTDPEEGQSASPGGPVSI